jgi:UDP-glucose 4-epimerase
MPERKTRVAVIGATGSTGIYLTDYLSAGNYSIFATGRKKRQADYYTKRGITYFPVDISQKDDFKKLPGDMDCVVLLAGLMPARMEGYDPEKYIQVNTIGTLNALEYCRVNKIPKIIFAQSHSDVAGHWNTGKHIPADAERRLNYRGDHAVYIISKCAAVDLIEHYHQEYGLQSIVFRMPTIYCFWPDDTYYVNGIKRHIAYLKIIKQAMAGEAIEIWGDPLISKDIVYIKDFIQLIDKAVRSTAAQGIYNVGTGTPTTLEEQIKGIIRVFCKPDTMSPVIYKPEKPSQTAFLYDMAKARKDLGYAVRYSYPAMLEDMKKEMNNPMFSEIL